MTVDHRQWAREAIRIIEADFQRSADTHLIPWRLPACLASNCTSGRVQPPHRQPQASPGALAVPLCAVQRLAQAGRAGDRGIERFHGDFRSLFRTPAGPALHRRDAGQHLEGKDRPDRLLRRPEPPGGGPHPDLRRVRTPGAGERWPFHGPVHLCRARHRLAGEQQHRRIDLPADAPRAVPDPDLADLQPRYRRHPGDPRPLRALSPALHPGTLRRRRAFGVLRRLCRATVA